MYKIIERWEVKSTLCTSNKFMRKFIIVLFLTTIIVAGFFQVPSIAASSSDFVDLHFTINSTSYYSSGVQKELDTAPFIEDGSTLVPFRVILEELGYNITWNEIDSSILAINGDTSIKLQINNPIASVNGMEKVMSIPPKIVGERAVVQLRFISENSGATVTWDDSTKSIYITRVGKFDTGKVLFYEEKDEANSKVYMYDGTNMNILPLNDRKIVNWYSYKGQILATIFDSARNKNSFVILKNDNFETLIDNFDIEETFEYNNNLIIHGYDRNQKYNKLYRFDGSKLYLIANNFYVGYHAIFKDKLIINKYDNTRNYLLLAFEKSSWVPGILSETFIIKDSIESDSMLYMTGVFEAGNSQPLASFDGKSINSSSFKILNNDLHVDISKIVSYNGEIYTFIDDKDGQNTLRIVDENGVSPVNFYSSINPSIQVKYNLNNITKFNGKLYLTVTGGEYKDPRIPNEIPQYASDDLLNDISIRQEILSKLTEDHPISPCLLEFNGDPKGLKMFINGEINDIKTDNKKLLILSAGNLYFFDGITLSNTTDVIGIKNHLTIDNKMFVDITDIDRITSSERNTIIIHQDNKIKNLVRNIEIKHWAQIGSSLVLSGYESDIDRNKLYSYGTVFNELLSNFNVEYWNKFPNILFVNGQNFDNNIYSLFRFTNDKKVNIKDGIKVIDMIKAKGNYYLVYTQQVEPNSDLDGKQVLYIYNDADREFILLKADMEISKMIFVK